MSNIFICAHTVKLDSKAIINELAAKGAIDDWCYNMRGTFFFHSELTVKELSKLFITRFGNVRHLFVEITDSAKWGLLPKSHWKKILNENERSQD